MIDATKFDLISAGQITRVECGRAENDEDMLLLNFDVQGTSMQLQLEEL